MKCWFSRVHDGWEIGPNNVGVGVGPLIVDVDFDSAAMTRSSCARTDKGTARLMAGIVVQTFDP